MVNRDYYSLDEAAKRSNCSVDDLLHLGALEQLDIYFLPAGLVFISEKYQNAEISERIMNQVITEPLKLSRRSLKLWEAGDKDALIKLDYEHDTTHTIKRYIEDSTLPKPDLFNFNLPTLDELPAIAQKARNQYSDVKISEVRLVIKHEALMSLTKKLIGSKANTNQSETERTKMLQLIIGMAIDAYGYKPDSTRNSATGDKNGISAKLQKHNIDINDDTIRKYLNEAKNLIGR